MDTRPTNVDYSHAQWTWPSWKFNLRLDELFGSLYDQYNTIQIPILEPLAFHHDVSDVCSSAATLEEFHAQLKERREQRVQELRECWKAVSVGIATWPPALDRNDEAFAIERWAAFLHFSREFSFDTLARYFSLFTHKERSAASPSLPAPASPSLRSPQPSSPAASRPSPAPVQPHKRRTSNQDGNHEPSEQISQSTTSRTAEAFSASPRRTSSATSGVSHQPPITKPLCSLRDPDPSSNIAISAAGHDDHLTPQTDLPSLSQSTGSVLGGTLTEIQSWPLSSILTTNKSRELGTASNSTMPQNRKRLITPATASLADDDKDEMRPRKKIRVDDDMLTPKAQSPPTLTDRPTLK